MVDEVLAFGNRAKRDGDRDMKTTVKEFTFHGGRIVILRIRQTAAAWVETRVERNWNDKNCGVYATQYRGGFIATLKRRHRFFRITRRVHESFSMARALTSVFSPIYPSWNVTARVLWQSNTVVFKMAGFTRVTSVTVRGGWTLSPSSLFRPLIDNACDSVASPLSFSLLCLFSLFLNPSTRD